MVDRRPDALRRLAHMLRLERTFARAVEAALQVLLGRTRTQLGTRLDPAVLDEQDPAWLDAVAEHIGPEVLAVYVDGMRRQADLGTVDAHPYAVRYLEAVHSRLVGTAGEVFDAVREELIEGHRLGETMPELAARVDAALGDSERWANRATVVARTEVIAANNAGAHEGAGYTADQLGVARTAVVKEWLDTPDSRTRATHRHGTGVGGVQVMGLEALFTVGEARMPIPGFVGGPPEEVIQCRCSCLYLMPGDPGYPDSLAASGGPMPDVRRPAHQQSALLAAGAPCTDHPCVCIGCDTFDCGLDGCACCWTYDAADQLILTPESPDDDKLQALAAAAPLSIATFDVSRMPPKLQAYWLSGPGAAKIGYGAPGQFKRCQAGLRGKVPGHMIDGTCANLIHKATGEWPGKHGGQSTADVLAAAGDDISELYGVVRLREADGTERLLTEDDLRRAAAGEDIGELVGLPTFAADGDSPMVEPPPGAIPADADPAYDPEDEEPNTGAWVGLLPAADEDVHGIGPEVKHCTMFYFGDTADLTDRDHTDLATLLQQWAATNPPETSQVTGMDTLGKDRQNGAYVWLLDDELQGPREALASTPLMSRLLEQASDLQYPTYLPHVTVGYPSDQGDTVEDTAWPAIEDAAADVTAVRFDRVALWWGDHKTDWPLTGDAPTPPAAGAQSDPTVPDPGEDPVTAAATEPVQADAATDTDLTWSGVLAPENVRTGDKRQFADGAIQWMASPVVLKAMFSDKPGHDDSVPVGLITGIERVDGKLVAHGTWDTGENAVEARRQNIAGLLRGVSVDLDDVEAHIEDAAGNTVEGDAIWELTEEPWFVVDKARLRSATLWCIPAFVEAYVLDSTVADQVPDTSIVSSTASPLAMAAAAAYTEPVTAPAAAAPASAFANPGLTEPTKITVTADGRVFGHLACWGVCHIGIDGACVTPPHSEADYAYFATGVYSTSDGEVLPVGTLTMGTGHADLSLGWRPTVDHYDHTGTAACYVNIGEDDIGIWVAGALDEYLPERQRLALMRSGSISGDWRGIGGSLELVAGLVVNVPGFPIPAVRSMAASAGRGALIASGVVPVPAEPASAPTIADLAREVVAFQARQTRRDAAARRHRKQRQAALGRRLTGKV